MQRPANHESYCLHCHAPASLRAEACSRCRAPFVGSGSFDRISGPRPSSLFMQLFAPAKALHTNG